MLNNPLINRYRCSSLRPKQFWVNLFVYGLVVGIILLVNCLSFEVPLMSNLTDAAVIKKFFVTLAGQFFVFQIFIAWFWSGYNSGNAIKDEITGRTYDFFKMLPLTAFQKTTGILIGKNSVSSIFFMTNFVLLFFFAVKGGIAFQLQLQYLLFLICSTFLVNGIALLAATFYKVKSKTTSFVALFCLFWFVGLPVMGLVMSCSEDQLLETIFCAFYMIRIPLIILIALICLYLGIWAFIGCLRRFTYENEALFTRKGAVLFFTGYLCVALGLFWNPLMEAASSDSITNVQGWYFLLWIVSFLPIFWLPFSSGKKFDEYIEYGGKNLLTEQKMKLQWTDLLRYSNVTLWLGLFGLWAVFVLCVGIYFGLFLGLILQVVMILFSFILVLFLLLEVYILFSPCLKNIKVLLLALLMSYLFLPLIIGNLLHNDAIIQCSLFSFSMFFELCKDGSKFIALPMTALKVNIFLILIEIYLIVGRYKKILEVRERM